MFYFYQLIIQVLIKHRMSSAVDISVLMVKHNNKMQGPRPQILITNVDINGNRVHLCTLPRVQDNKVICSPTSDLNITRHMST